MWFRIRGGSGEDRDIGNSTVVVLASMFMAWGRGLVYIHVLKMNSVIFSVDLERTKLGKKER